jgi:hypothetical protein
MHLAWFQYFQIVCLIAALYSYSGLRACSLLAFIPYLVIVNITEIIGINFHNAFGGGNYPIYNVYLLVSTPFYFYVAGKMLFLTGKERAVFYLVCVLCMSLVVANYFFIQGTTRFDTYSLVLIEIMKIVFSGLGLVRLTVLDQNELNFMREPFFWINCMSLLFGMITLVVLGLQEYILINHIEIAHRTLYYVLMPSVNAIVYSGYTYAFILCRTQKTR